MKIDELLKNKTFKKETRKTTEYGELSKEMSLFFHRNCFWIPYRYEMWSIREKFNQIKQLPKSKQNLSFFLGMLKQNERNKTYPI